MPCPQWVVDLANEGKTTQAISQPDTARAIRDLLPQGQERNGEWVVHCPFHDDKNPSCSVRLSDGIYNCFGCGAKGNLVKLYAQVKSVTEAAARRALGLAPSCIAELNQKHAVTKVGGKCVILTEIYDPVLDRKDIALSSPTDLRLEYGNQHEWVGKPLRAKPVVDVWLGHKDRRQYKSIVFAPNRKVPGYYNLWQGFPVEAKKGDCSLYLNHLKDNIAQGDEERYEYLLAWMAQMIQHPEKRVGVSLALRGKQGTGKGVMVTQLGKLLGKHFVHITQQNQLLGNFNAHLKDALLVFADEAFWAGNKASEGPLKGLVTEDQLAIEYKGKDVIPVKNHVHLIVASNHEWVVPAGPAERRFCILDVGEQQMQNGPYFEAIVNQMEAGGYEALLYMLQHYELKGKNLRVFPQTEALLENKMLTMGKFEKYWLGKLIKWYLSDYAKEEGWCRTVKRETLHRDYQYFVQDLGQTRKSTETELGMGLKRLVPGLRGMERTVDGKQELIWEIPDLDTCRKAFEEVLKYPYPWDSEPQEEDTTRPPGP